ncbi:hypothetical protein GQ54DRAFT_248225, partial [Martensiomyces pterosporus]
SGRFRLAVATNALGAGIDIPHIRHVVHIHPSNSLLDYAQESGRAGRDGEAAVAHMFV